MQIQSKEMNTLGGNLERVEIYENRYYTGECPECNYEFHDEDDPSDKWICPSDKWICPSCGREFEVDLI